MKALIMAAGKGSRISGEVGDVPKCTLPLPDKTPMIRRSVQMMLELGIEPVVCVGYQGQKVKDALRKLTVRYYENPFYSVTNNIASLWFSLSELDGKDDILLLSGDLYYPKSFLIKALAAKGNLTMFVDTSRICDGDFYFHLDSEGYVDNFGPKLPPQMRYCEYMGFSKISASFVPPFAKRVLEYVAREEYMLYFENIVLSYSTSHEQKIQLVDVAGEFWREYDYFEDYQLILNYERGNDCAQ